MRFKQTSFLAVTIAVSCVFPVTAHAVPATTIPEEPTPPAWAMEMTPEKAETFEPTAAQTAEMQEYDRKLVAHVMATIEEDFKKRDQGPQPSANEKPTVGQFFVSLQINSGSSAIGVGHAAIISTNPSQTMEAYPKKYSPIGKEGVQKLSTAEWKKRKKSMRARPNDGATPSNYFKAGKYAESKEGKPYNWKFHSKWRNDAFYCSQLVWRSWKEQKVELLGAVQSKMGAVSPAMLLNGNKAKILQRY
ncbi:hypothetical protein KEM60_01582 [Austwickia sp. TVS 96-490-7B]|uniref:YiiX/YebB-like N1pC/P60 family cysteine hydrolase n=1 Tax=Austwickia sp. TVS 96-490-7B TaxID=2830843 RepID=UPI001C581AB5|nr:YiiX/YebB-like N1pC/P60 family cysteine hydrolase [Austwickia sp. TVS 96-490-7B]MBW3085382.1 hypothetical protein [Austwickia sp. TVS 96-490-7B]